MGAIILGWAMAWAAWPAPAVGQQIRWSMRSRPVAADDHAIPAPAPAVRATRWRPLAIAKWGVLGATAVAAVYGLSASIEADGLYDRISQICASDAGRCAVLPEGGYADEEVARLDRDAHELDERARHGLLATQIGVAATLALFILDLRDGGPPPNVPYVPPQLRVGFGRDGAFRIAGRIATP